MGFCSDLRILYYLACKRTRGASHAERLESFYGGQASGYDDFRRRLLTGRDDLMKAMEPRAGEVWVDMGGGTGANLELLGDNLAKLEKLYLVDLTESMLKVAQERIERNGWTNVETLRADATTWRPERGSVDAIFFSYSLTMIPDWFAAVDRAFEALKPGGKIGVVDFYIARKFPSEGRAKQSFSTRSFWPIWFSCDNLFLSSDHLPYLSQKFEETLLVERADRMPYCPVFWKKMPRYVFVGRKPLDAE